TSRRSRVNSMTRSVTSLLAVSLVCFAAPLYADDPPAEGPGQAAEIARLEKLVGDADAKTNAKAWKEASDLYKQAISEAEKAKIPDAPKIKILIHAVY